MLTLTLHKNINCLHCSILFPFPWPKSWPKWRLASLIKDRRSTGPYKAENQKRMLKKDNQSICNDTDVVINCRTAFFRNKTFRMYTYEPPRAPHNSAGLLVAIGHHGSGYRCIYIYIYMRFINFGWKDPEAAVFFPTWAWDLSVIMITILPLNLCSQY